MIDAALITAFAETVGKSSLLQVMRDGVVDFLAEKARDIAGDELKNRIESLRSDAKLNQQIQKALERAAQRWVEDSPDIELVTAVARDTTFHDLESVKKAIRKVAQAPFHPIAADSLRGSFKDVLPARFDEERIKQGIVEFLNILREEFAAIPALQPTLQTFADLQTANYTSYLPILRDLLNQLVHGPTVTEETLQNYLRWVLDQHRYLDPKGTMQTVRQVQVLLEEVYVSLQAEEELPLNGVDRKLYEDEIKVIQERQGLQEEERDDLLEDFQARYLKEERIPNVKPVELAELAQKNEKLVILGDPGAGKTTLMRYLALKHAQAMRSGVEVSEELGNVYLPVYLRIAEYAEHADGQSLENFLPLNLCGKNHSDKSLVTLITENLNQGKCIILLDGLDEVVDSGQRSLIAAQINGLIRNYHTKGNRIVITSRPAGYRNSPLAGDIPHYRVRDMNDDQIERFLNQWCNAVERFQTPNLSSEAQQANAQKEITGIIHSIKNSAGVKRLAANPLLLRTLALIHRTGARLPQRRIELYKLAADTLIKDWELARGIPEAALINDEEATRLLSELAIWIHENKPAGLATEGEIQNILAEVKADQAGKEPDDPDILKAVSKFLEKIRHQTGLFVERAPRRFGFMHLTFEEYFAARWLVNKPRDAARRIRAKLHRPRWEEPILLAIAFYGMNFDDVTDLVEEAILGKDLGGPSPYEEILHRDLFFAIRLLGDQDVKSYLRDRLIHQFMEIWFDEKGMGRFDPIRNQWDQIFRIIVNSKAGQKLTNLLIAALHDENEGVRASAARALRNATQFPETVTALLAALHDENEGVRANAASALRNATQFPETVTALLAALHDENEGVRANAAFALRNATQFPEVVTALIAALHDENEGVGGRATSALSDATLSAEAVTALLAALRDENEGVRARAAETLRTATLSIEAVTALIVALHDENEGVRARAAETLSTVTQFPEAVTALIAALHDENEGVRASAAEALSNATQFPEAVTALIAALHDEQASVRARAASALSDATQFPEAVTALIAALHDENEDVCARAAFALSTVTQFPEAVTALIVALHDENGGVRARAAEALINATQFPEVVTALLAALHDENGGVRARAAFALSNATQFPEAVTALIPALRDKNGGVRATATFSLRNTTLSAEAVTALIAALRDENEGVCASAASVLSDATLSMDAVTALIVALHDENEGVRARAASALRNTTQFPEAVTALIAALHDENGGVRANAASALRNTTQFPEAVTALIAALQDEQTSVRFRAAESLRSITQNVKFTQSKAFSHQLASSLLLPNLQAEVPSFIVVNHVIQHYSALDCLFDALMAVAEYPRVT